MNASARKQNSTELLGLTTPTEGPHIAVHSLGQAEVLVDGVAANWHAESAKELFFFLLSHPNGASKQDIFHRLWNLDVTPATNNRFRVAVHALGWPDAIVEEYGRYHLCKELLSSTDIHGLYTALQHASQTTNPNERLQAYQQALALYGGDYLPGESAEWVLEVREENRAAYVRAAIELSLIHCDHGSCKSAVAALVRALRADPFIGENYHQKLMACLSVVEGKYAAIEHYRRFLAFLRHELGDTAMGETHQLAERIKGGAVICQRIEAAGGDMHLTNNCPLTADGACSGVLNERTKLT